MADILRLPNRSRASEEAAAWIARVDRGLREGEPQELAEWLAADPSHEQALLETAALWDDLDVLSELASIFPLQATDAARPPPAAFPARARAAVAAGLVLLVTVVAGVVALRWSGEAPEGDAAFAGQFRTAVGELETASLPDGSRLTLNTDTVVSVSYTATGRNVFLERGEAHFEVARDPSVPFAVLAGDRIVRALGTAFSVHLERSRSIEVTVTEGRVSILSRDARNADRTRPLPGPEQAPEEAVVAAGETAVVTGSTHAVSRLAPSDLDRKLAWQRGMLIFEGEPLAEVLSEVNRYTSTPILLGDGSLGATRVGGYFRTDDIDALLVALRENFAIESEVSAGRIVLHRKTD